MIGRFRFEQVVRGSGPGVVRDGRWEVARVEAGDTKDARRSDASCLRSEAFWSGEGTVGADDVDPYFSFGGEAF